MLPLLVLGLVLGPLLYFYGTKSYDYWRKRNVPHPRPLPFFGNTINVALMRTSVADEVQRIYNEYENVPYVGIYELTTPVLLIRDPSLIKLVLIKDFDHFQGRGIPFNENVDPLSAHLITLTGKRWRTLRTKLTPVFSTGKMRSIFTLIAESSNRFKEYVKKYADREATLEFRDLAAKYTSEVISTCCFGLDPNTMQDEDSEFRAACRKVLDPSLVIALKKVIRMYMPWTYRFFSLTLNPTDVSEYFVRIVKEMMAYRETNNVERQDFLQTLIDMKNADKSDDVPNLDEGMKKAKHESKNGSSSASDMIIDDNIIAAQSYVFFLAGTETSYGTISFALYELAVNIDIQKKLREEIRTILNKHGSITYDAISEMQLLDCVVRETLRKYPPVGMVPRLCNETYKMPGTDVIIEKGMKVLVPIYAIHHDPLHYNEPSKFNPDRFLEPKKNCTYLPFGDGPRICIGSRFAFAQVKACLVGLLSDYEFVSHPKTTSPMEFEITSNTLHPKSGIWLTIRHCQEPLTTVHQNGNVHDSDK